MVKGRRYQWGASALSAEIRQYIRKNRRNRSLQLLADWSEKYLRAFYNSAFFEFDKNGENFALSTFARWNDNRSISIWDVGANRGQWAEAANLKFPFAILESFEIVPSIADQLEDHLGTKDWINIHRLGLSDKPGVVEVSYNHNYESLSGINTRSGIKDENVSFVDCEVTTIDDLIGRGVKAPVFLKIDTEGHDAAVLRGAKRLLGSNQSPEMIQFEYGSTWIPSSETLEKTQGLLSEYGYHVGRLYPDHVHFKEYAYTDEHFRMGNMIAVKKEELRKALAKGWSE